MPATAPDGHAASTAPVPRKTVLVRGVPAAMTKAQLEDVCSRVGPVKWCFMVAHKGDPAKSRGFGFVQYALADDAQAAMTSLKDEPELTGCRIEYAKPKEVRDGQKSKTREPGQQQQPPKAKDAASAAPAANRVHAGRLIVRNLSFNANEDLLRKLFKRHGTITEIVIPRKENPKTHKMNSLGFAFVQYETRAMATQAMKAMNGQTVLDRPVAVDLSLPKDKYEQTVADTEPADENDGDDTEEEDEDENSDEEREDEDNDDGDDGDDDNEDGDDDEDEGDDNDDDDDDNDDDEDKKPVKKQSNDVSEGKTLFIRNLSFTSNEDEIEELLSEFGELAYCVLVTDKETGRPRGTAFVKFKTADAAKACLDKAGHYRNEEVPLNATTKKNRKTRVAAYSVVQDDSVTEGIHLQGRRLNITQAINREEAQQKTAEAEKKLAKKRDKRNLYLAREGYIKPDSPEAVGLSKGDLAKRASAEAEKKLKMKNPNFSVSKTRLSVRNLPITLTNAELRKLFASAARQRLAIARQHRAQSGNSDQHDELDAEGAEAKVFVTQAKIVCNTDRTTASGQARSKGYGFVEFSQHGHALAALRHVNNNPTLFGPARRPIVEFAFDNALKLKARSDRHTRATTRASNSNPPVARSSSSLPSPPTKRKAFVTAESVPVRTKRRRV